MPNLHTCFWKINVHLFTAPKLLKSGTTKRRVGRRKKIKRKRHQAALLRQRQRTVGRSWETTEQGRRSGQHVRVRRRPPRQTGRKQRQRTRAAKTTRPKPAMESPWSQPGSVMPSRSPRARRKWLGPSSHQFPDQSRRNLRGVRGLSRYLLISFARCKQLQCWKSFHP